MNHRNYYPYALLESVVSSSNYGIIILNYSLDSLRHLLTKNLWQQAKIRGCADGGSNMLRQFADETNEQFLPDFISGDFDSIDELTSKFYHAISSIDFIFTQDQNATDFTKCVRILMDKQSTIDTLLVFCSLGGRFDHSIGIIHTLFLLEQVYPKLQVYLFTDHDIIFLLRANEQSRIHVQSKFKGNICSLLPIGRTAHVRTEGLKWNLTSSQELSFGTLVSSSNSYESMATSYVDISTDNAIVWTMTYVCEK